MEKIRSFFSAIHSNRWYWIPFYISIALIVGVIYGKVS